MKTTTKSENQSRIQPKKLLALPAVMLLLGLTRSLALGAQSDVDPSFDPKIIGNVQWDTYVNAIAVQNDGKVLIGGVFATVSGTAQNGLARLRSNGSVDSGFLASLAGQYVRVDGLALRTDGKILIRGYFTSVDGIARTNIALLNGNGSLDSSFATSLTAQWDPALKTFAFQSDDKVLIGGNFTNVNGVARAYLARLHPDGSLDNSFLGGLAGPNSGVTSILLQEDGKVLVAGYFTTINGVARTKLVRLNADGSLDNSFVPVFSPQQYDVESIALQSDGKILIGGEWSQPSPPWRVYVARLNAEGSVDTSFTNVPFGSDPTFNALVVQPDGKVLYGCTFRGDAAHGFGRLNADGSPDSSFITVLEGSLLAPVPFAIALQADGKVLVVGTFIAINQTPRSYVARLMGNYAALELVGSSPSQTAEEGNMVNLRLKLVAYPPPAIQWYYNSNPLAGCTNCTLEFVHAQPLHSGVYTAIITNAAGAVTSAPAILNVIPPVERRPVPGINLFGEAGSLLNVDYVNSFSPAPDWLPLESVSLINTSQYCFDLTAPLPPQRFYRAWQTGTTAVLPSLNLNFIPAITLSGDIGNAVRVDGINQFGPTDAWFTLDTVSLTNTSQLYFDVTAPGQPARLYRLVPVP